jgi:hypothetical protein
MEKPQISRQFAVNFVTFGADTPEVKGTDSYFVRLDGDASTSAPGHRGTVARESFEASEGPKKRRRHRRFNGRSFLLLCLLVAVGGWFAWASQQPGGASGTINGWIEDVRGDVARVSTDPDLNAATKYYSKQYKSTGVYPRMSENDLGAAGIGLGVNVEWCSRNAVVLQGTVGGGTASRLLLAGEEIGTEQGRHGCPTDFDSPAPWKP